MADTESAGAARETAVGNQGALLAHVHALDVRSGIKHFLHTGASLRTFVGYDDTVALLHLSAENALTGIFLRVEHHSRTLKVPEALVNACRLHHTAVLGNVAEENGQSAVLGVSMRNVAYATFSTVGVQRGIHL